ncbi:NAD dependent epimerase/dehydratase family protein-like protein [Hyaloraphidium curvatum]|nr:NAD dependent epimerase/dehydratase family protein-like protein [Hyaloraphidium curvatum]
MSHSPPRNPSILLTGATGFVGGAVLHQLLTSTAPTLQNATITCLLRGEERAAQLADEYKSDRLRAVVYAGVDDLEAAEELASQSDVVVNAGVGYHLPSAVALLRGLARRKQALAEGGDSTTSVYMLHTSGTSNLADLRISKRWVDPEHPDGRIFDDEKDDIYAYEKMRNADKEYIQRTAELGVIDAGSELGVPTLVIMPPTIFGLSSGLFTKVSIQIPAFFFGALTYGRSIVVGDGKGVNGRVHVADLAELYELAVLDMLCGGTKLPKGRKAIIFAGNGEFSWLEAAERVGQACFEAGKISDATVESVSLREATEIWGSSYRAEATEDMVETGMTGNSRTVASVARNKLGWKPSRGDEAWLKGFADDLSIVLQGTR